MLLSPWLGVALREGNRRIILEALGSVLVVLLLFLKLWLKKKKKKDQNAALKLRINMHFSERTKKV